jgi:transposase
MGAARDAAFGAARSADPLDLHLRCHLPGPGNRRRPRPAALQHRRDGLASRRNLPNGDAGAHAVVLLDQAGWHLSDKLDIPDNITLMPLPPKSPELNPVENIWQFIRDNWLSNRVFQSYDDILDHCCFAWNKLVDQPWTIMSIGLRDWAHRF